MNRRAASSRRAVFVFVYTENPARVKIQNNFRRSFRDSRKAYKNSVWTSDKFFAYAV